MDSNIILTTITSSALFVLVIQWLKGSKWFPFLQHGQKWASRTASLLFAIAGHAGVSYVWNPTGRTLILTIPTVWTALVGLWHVANHFALQETIYQSTVNKVSTTTQADAGPTIPARVNAAGALVVPKEGS